MRWRSWWLSLNIKIFFWLICYKENYWNVSYCLYPDDNILYLNEDSDDVMFSCNEMGVLSIDFNDINLSGTNYAENDPETVINIKILAWYSKFEKHKAPKKELNE